MNDSDYTIQIIRAALPVHRKIETNMEA